MPISRFRSFHDTAILHFTLKVVDGLPLLADEAIPEILRKVWLYSAVREGWFVGMYSIQPDCVSLFASPASAAAPSSAWVASWQEITTRQINEATRGAGRIWAACPPPLSVASVDDYLRLCASMSAGPSATLKADASAAPGCAGMIWQLLPAGEPPPAEFAPLELI